MKIDIYRSVKNHTLYYSVPSGSDVVGLPFSSDIQQNGKPPRPFKAQHEIVAGRPYVALNAQDLIDQIESKGYAVHGAKIEILEKLSGSLPNLTPTEEFMAEKRAENEREEAKNNVRF